MDTFELLPSLASGDLAETSAPELVAAVFRSRASGTLWLEVQDGAEIRLFFRAGEVCGAGPFAGFQTLAQVLLVHDWVNALDIDTTRSEAEATGKRHGEVLVAQRLLKPDQLKTALAEQHRHNLGAVLSLRAGRYDWRGWEPPPAWAREVAVDPVGCIIEALEQEGAAPRRQRVIDWLGESAARLSVDWPELQGRIALQAADRRAAALLALPRKVPEFVQAARLPQVHAEALLATLLLAGAAEPQPAGAPAQPPVRTAPAPAPPVARTSAPPAARNTPTSVPPAARTAPASVPPAARPAPVSRPAPSRRPAPPPPDLEAEILEDLPLEPSGDLPAFEPIVENLEPMLDEAVVEEDLIEPAQEEAGLEELPLAMEEPGFDEPPHDAPALVHPEPDPFASPPLAKAPPSRRSAPPRVTEQEAFDRLDSLSLDDLSVGARESQRAQASPHDDLDLSLDEPPQPAPQHRSSLDGSPDEPLPGLERPGARADEARGQETRRKLLQRGLRNLGALPVKESLEPELDEAVAAPQDPPAAPAALTPDERAFIEDVRARLRAAPGQTAYARLGQTPQATNEQLKAAYLQAAKRFHPDRASSSPGLASLQGELEQLFSAMKEAYDLVATTEARARYDATVQAAAAASKPPSRKEEAAATLKAGDALIKKRDFEGGLAKLRRAVELEPSGDALAALAWGLVCDPRQPASAKEEAASLVNRALRAQGATARTFYVAGVIWRTRDPDSAVDAFRKALELEPNHPDASLELRLLESRRGKAQKGGAGVLSGLLFGKRK